MSVIKTRGHQLFPVLDAVQIDIAGLGVFEIERNLARHREGFDGDADRRPEGPSTAKGRSPAARGTGGPFPMS